MSRLHGRRTFVLGSAASAIGAYAGLVRSGPSASAQVAGGTLVPTSVAGQNAFEFVLTAHQLGFEFTFYGYVTRVAGIQPSLLFSNTDPTNRGPADARLTMHGTVAASSRSIIEQVFNVNGEGTLDFYLSDGGARFEDPASFQAGTLVATGSASIQNVISVIAPQTGLAHGYGSVSIESAEPFAIGDVRYVFQTGGNPMRLSYNGQGTLLDPELPESMIYVVGNGATAR